MKCDFVDQKNCGVEEDMQREYEMAVSPADDMSALPLQESSDNPENGDQAPGADGLNRRLLALIVVPTSAMYAMFQASQQILLPAQVEAINPAAKIGNLAVLTVISSICAVLGLLSGGALSDRTRSRFGRRTPWLVAMASLSAICLLALSQTTKLLPLMIIAGALWYFSNFFQGVLTAVLPDRIAPSRRGIAASIIALGTPIGILLGVNVAARMPAELTYISLAIFLVAATLAFVTIEKEGPYLKPLPPKTPRVGSLQLNIFNGAKTFLSSFGHRDFSLVFASRALMYLAHFSITSYMYYILTDYVGRSALPNGDPKIATGILTSVNTIVWAITISGAGWVADRLDRRKVIVGVAGLGMAASLMYPTFDSSWTSMIIFKAGVGMFFGTYLAVDLALMSLVLPNKETQGRDMAILAVATSGTQIFAPLFAGAVIAAFGYDQLFFIASSIAICGASLIFFVKSVR